MLSGPVLYFLSFFFCRFFSVVSFCPLFFGFSLRSFLHILMHGYSSTSRLLCISSFRSIVWCFQIHRMVFSDPSYGCSSLSSELSKWPYYEALSANMLSPTVDMNGALKIIFIDFFSVSVVWSNLLFNSIFSPPFPPAGWSRTSCPWPPTSWL